ncbi:MAG TPA: protein MnhE [Candidatus Desulfofervidus auxilii]|uniref:Protein MnhE n=1 Tax=Desulfofervidus auxilii TaxID=1621989 RepID=A0A7V0I9J1_DESA2|nr:protein MnhE [Candidatus Desulfofervidus auxilii]
MAFWVTYIILIIFWISVSGHFDAWHFGLGILCCALVAYMSNGLLFKDIRSKDKPKEVVNFIFYLPWLLYQILLANIHVAYLALHPRMSEIIDPHIIKFKTKLKKELALVTFANSITLTPGTITILIKDGYFYVHAIDRFVAEALPGDMEERIARLYLEV